VNFYNSQIPNHSKTNSHNTLIPNIIIDSKSQTKKKKEQKHEEKKKNFEKQVDPTRHFASQVWVDTIFVPGSKNPYPYPYFSFGFGSGNGSESNFVRSSTLQSKVFLNSHI
jgi:hypothetical protein